MFVSTNSISLGRWLNGRNSSKPLLCEFEVVGLSLCMFHYYSGVHHAMYVRV
jgi:hypothetical protein